MMEESFPVPVQHSDSSGMGTATTANASLAMPPHHSSTMSIAGFYGQEDDDGLVGGGCIDMDMVPESTSVLSSVTQNRRKPRGVGGAKRKCPEDDPNEASRRKRQTSQDIQNQRHLANVRERQRTQSLNERFARLRRIVPTMPSDKMSKIHTLRLATYYIHFLSQMLDGQNSMIDQVETVDTAAFVHQLRYAFSVWRMGTTLHTPLEMNNNTPNESGSHQSSSSEQPYNNPYH
ncbi:twist-related protein 2-like isoform X2 [Varroa jacobsoni]|uniref:BHLH domain-containing protein n=1 Tax=Varroa destructor TaxID=109461 RepID=A0A7M7KBB2_VARDE|nr:twist-related protein 2-like isoform X2 [Varroa destructor]XP_022698546.1 twist-related protein 2-like isoform X2 [Varroa jacobsoni]